VERWKVVAGMALLVVFGFLCGAVATTLWWRQFDGHRPHGALGALMAPEVAERLALEPRQREVFQVVAGEARGRLLALRQEFRPRADAILDGAFGRLEAVLKPEQREQLRAIRKEHERADPNSPRPTP